MRDALIGMRPANMRQFEFGRILIEHFDDTADFRIGHAGGAERTIDGRQIMIRHGEMLLRPARFAALHPQLIEGEKRLAFIDQIEIDTEQFLALRRHHDDVVGPDFLEQRAGAAHCSNPSLAKIARFSS